MNVVVFADSARDRPLGVVGGKLPVGVANEIGGRRLGGVDDGARAPRAQPVERRRARADDQITADQHVGRANARAVQRRRIGADAHVRHHRAALLGCAGHVEHRDAAAFEVRSHAEQRARGDDTGAADARDEHFPRPIMQHDRCRQRQRRRRIAVAVAVVVVVAARDRRRPAQGAALDGDEARAEALQAREVLVAAGLVDCALAAELGLERFHRQAVALHRAVATAFADELVDHDAPRRVGEFVALAAAPLLGGTRLVVHQHRNAFDVAQLALHRVEPVAMAHLDVGREAGARLAVVLVGLVGDDDDAPHTFGRDLARQRRHVERAVEGLAAGHRDGVVEEDLVGDRHLGRDRRANREQTGVEVGAVAEVGEDVLVLREARLADPGNAFRAHVRPCRRAPIHPRHHAMAADAGNRPRAFGNDGRGVVWTARAEVRNALRAERRRRGQLRIGQARALRREPLGAMQALEPGDDHRRDGGRRQLELGVEQPRADGRGAAALVVLADDTRPYTRQVVQDLLDLALDEGALLLDDEDLLEPRGKLAQALGLERPRECRLVQAQPERGGGLLADAEQVERLADVEVGLAGADDAEAGLRRVEHDAIKPVRAYVGLCRSEPMVEEARLLLRRRVGPAQTEAAFGQRRVRGQHDPNALRVDVDRGRRLDRVGHALEADPEAAVARQGPAVQAEVEELLDVGRIEHGNHARDHDLLALTRQRRRLGAVVVAEDREHAAERRAARRVGVLQRVDTSVDPGRLAVPHREDASDFRRVQRHLLAAPDRRRGEVLVDAGLELDVVALEVLRRRPQCQVDAAEGRASVARDEARRVEAGGAVALALQHRQADERLRRRQVDPAAFEQVFVVERDCGQRGRRERSVHIGLVGRIRARLAPPL